MCGIAGIVNRSGDFVEPTVIKKMTDALSHRGPDGEGQHIVKNVGLGHRRLAIIDISQAGNQPMTSRDENKVISYNGEIYNFRELRKELQREGIEFRTKSDTEVVLKALEFWGEDALKRFNGMFALAFLDLNSNTLMLARDRYGIKPLYFSQQDENLFLLRSKRQYRFQTSEGSSISQPVSILHFRIFHRPDTFKRYSDASRTYSED